MAVLMVANNEANAEQIIVGTRNDLNEQNGHPLSPGDSFNFPGGEDTARVYVLSAKDGVIDVTYRAQAVLAAVPSTPGIKIGTLQCSVYEDTGDGLLGEPGIRGATCIARNQQTKEEYIGTTNSFGFALLPVPYGSYVVTMKAPHFSTQVVAATVTDGLSFVDAHLQKVK